LVAQLSQDNGEDYISRLANGLNMVLKDNPGILK